MGSLPTELVFAALEIHTLQIKDRPASLAQKDVLLVQIVSDANHANRDLFTTSTNVYNVQDPIIL